MIPAKPKGLKEATIQLTSHIENGVELDRFSLRSAVSFAETLEDDALRLMLLGLAYGAAKQNDKAISFFKAAADYGDDDRVVINFLSYLAHTGQCGLYRDESIRLARIYENNPRILRLARNASYADGNGELSLYFARRVLAMMPDGSEKDAMQEDVDLNNDQLARFIEATNLETAKISELTRMVANLAANYNVIAVSHDYYTSPDGSAAIICDVICENSDVISDMDIDIATKLATSEFFVDKNVTAWYRGRKREEVSYTS
ncbi:hypothetical protein [Pectobacterium carotovorum]|uniref:hypothetical protein n=1 Tax=Pectobacterium carotovorum TaxID=554 RepID=UPI00301AAF72